MSGGSLSPIVLIVLVAAIPLVVLSPLQNVPFGDDWTFAWSVEHLLDAGEFRILDWSTSLNVVHVLWGALFCLPFGFSFTALRLSTWVASLLGLVGFYGLLRELGVSRRHALTGAAVLGFYPVYFILSFTFMTDVPFLTAMTWCLWALVRALRTRRDVPLVGAAVCACLAIGIRPVGIVLPGAMLAGLLFHSDRWGIRAHRLLLVAIPLAFLALLVVAREHVTAYRADLRWIEGSYTQHMAHLKFGIRDLPEWLAVNLTLTVGTLGVALAPVALASISRETLRAGVTAASAIGAIFLVNVLLGWRVWTPLAFGYMWSLQELGLTEDSLGPTLGWRPPSWWTPASTAAAVVLFSLAMAPLRWRRLPAEGMVLAWGWAGYFVLMAVLWFFFDRYALPLLPLGLALWFGSRVPLRTRPALVGVAAFAAISFLGTWDHLRYSEAMWVAVDWLQRRGAQARDIDGGYVVNGWLQYAHPENANRAPNGDVLVPEVNSRYPLRYTIRNLPATDGQVLHSVAYRRLLAPSGRIYVSEQHRPDDQRRK